jgi:hypothetical protein
VAAIRSRPPGFFWVEPPWLLWHLDMTSILVAEHGWVYLNVIIWRCSTGVDHRLLHPWDRRLGSVRCHAAEAIALIQAAASEQGIRPGTLTVSTDNGSALVARATRFVLSALGVTTAAAATATPSARRSSRASQQGVGRRSDVVGI